MTVTPRRVTAIALVLLLASAFVFAGGQGEEDGDVPTIELVHWSHWVTNNAVYEPFWAEAAQRFNEEHPEVNFSLEVVSVPYEGYEAKYSSAFEAQQGPDIYNGMTHVWSGQFDAADPMPADIAEKLDEILVDASKPYGVFNGQRYGLPVEGGNFMMLYINVDRFEEAGLDPDDPPERYTEMLEYAEALTRYDSNGNITHPGFGIRYKGHPFGIADKVAPFFNAWGAEWYSWEEKTASGYLNSDASKEALQFYGDMVQEHEVASLEMDNPAAVFGQGLAGMIMRESWYAAWLSQNAPNINFKVYPLPRQEMESGFGNNFPWAINVNKALDQETKDWVWEFVRWYVNNPEIRREHYVKSEMLPPYTDIVDDPYFAEKPEFEAWEEMAQGRAAPTYYNPPAHEILQVIGEATLSVMYGDETADSALDDAAVQVNEILSRYE